jgi:predicted nucleic acid-binding protein
VIYLDSSATLKLFVHELESTALQTWLATKRDATPVSSALTTVEVLRACRRRRPDLLPAAVDLLSGYDLLPVTSRVLTEAAAVDGAALRSLDALHLASALFIRSELTAFVAYDTRLSQAAADAGLPVIQPA